MRRAARENALWALLAAAGCASLGWLGLYGFAWSDYETEARPALQALVEGHLLGFLRLAPAYGGSLVERAPFALLPGLWGGGQLAVYRLVALPCLLAAGALGVWLTARMRSEARPLIPRVLVLLLCVANPLTLRALELGHPEELLGACLCVAAVLLAGAAAAGHTRPLWAALALGLAIANKEWALLAIGPVLLALAPGQRLRCLLCAAGLAALILGPLALVGSGGFTAATRASAAPAGTIFQPWQLWWFLGHHGALVHGLYGVPKPGYRNAPGSIGTLSHPLVIAAGLFVSLALWRREGRAGPVELRRALLALALVLLLRCLLDTWDTVYYSLPYIFALLAWEASGEPRRAPVLALSATFLSWISFQWLASRGSPDLQSALFIAWTLPLAGLLGLRLFAPRTQRAGRAAPAGAPARAQAMTVRRLSRPLRTS